MSCLLINDNFAKMLGGQSLALCRKQIWREKGTCPLMLIKDVPWLIKLMGLRALCNHKAFFLLSHLYYIHCLIFCRDNEQNELINIWKVFIELFIWKAVWFLL